MENFLFLPAFRSFLSYFRHFPPLSLSLSLSLSLGDFRYFRSFSKQISGFCSFQSFPVFRDSKMWFSIFQHTSLFRFSVEFFSLFRFSATFEAFPVFRIVSALSVVLYYINKWCFVGPLFNNRTCPFQVCRFNVDDLGAECTWQKDYGFDEGTPCILLKLNKVRFHFPVTPSNVQNVLSMTVSKH